MDDREFWYNKYWDLSIRYWDVVRDSDNKTLWMLGEAVVIAICVIVICCLEG